MFWSRKKPNTGQSIGPSTSYEDAKEATRRAAFLNVAQAMSEDEVYKRQLSELFRICRSAAISAGAMAGYSGAKVDAEIGALCDADTSRLKSSSDDEFRDFVRESGEIVTQFIGKLDL